MAVLQFGVNTFPPDERRARRRTHEARLERAAQGQYRRHSRDEYEQRQQFLESWPVGRTCAARCQDLPSGCVFLFVAAAHPGTDPVVRKDPCHIARGQTRVLFQQDKDGAILFVLQLPADIHEHQYQPSSADAARAPTSRMRPLCRHVVGACACVCALSTASPGNAAAIIDH